MKFLRRQKPLPLFLLFLIILTIGEGVGMGLASYFHKPLSGLETFQMMIPATAAFLVFRILAGQTQLFPKYVCRAFFAADILFLIAVVLESVLLPVSLSQTVSPILVLTGIVFFDLALFLESAETKDAYGLLCKTKIKTILFYLFLFLILQAGNYFIQTVFDYFSGNRHAFLDFIELYSHFPSALLRLPFFFLCVFLPYFGEEYGWRGFLQPRMQKQFGMKKGLILTGMIWGVWHLPLYLFRYPSSTLLQELLHQIACCVLIGIFMGYVYLKTKNIWICTAIHFLNNAMIGTLFPSVAESAPSSSLEDQAIGILAIFLVYGFFIGSRVFREKKILEDLLLPRTR